MGSISAAPPRCACVLLRVLGLGARVDGPIFKLAGRVQVRVRARCKYHKIRFRVGQHQCCSPWRGEQPLPLLSLDL